MNTENYWWQVVVINGEIKVKVHDMENQTTVYLSKTSVEQMSMDIAHKIRTLNKPVKLQNSSLYGKMGDKL